MKLTVDASVFVAALQPHERHHREAVRFFTEIELAGYEVHCPAILLTEIACAFARASRNAEKGSKAAAGVRKLPFLTLGTIDSEFAYLAGEIGAQAFVRAGDAYYLAIARALGSELITYDAEMADRSAQIVRVRTPGAWLKANGK